MATDIDKLFENAELIISNEPRPRSCGITFTYIWMMTNDIFTRPGNNYLYVGDTYNVAGYVGRTFGQILEKLSGQRLSSHLQSSDIHSISFEGKTFFFVDAKQCNLKGHRFNKIYVDTDEYSLWSFTTNSVDVLRSPETKVRDSRKELQRKFKEYLAPGGIII